VAAAVRSELGAVTADATAKIVITMTAMNKRDTDRLQLLDRIADRVPELDLAQQSVEWKTLDDGHEALLVNGGGIDGGTVPTSPTTVTTCTRLACWTRSSPATSAAS
jgi:hypothetical protein